MRFLAGIGTKSASGNSTLHSNICLKRVLLSAPSNGRYPLSIANRIIPQHQISLLNPSYFVPLNISGAA